MTDNIGRFSTQIFEYRGAEKRVVFDGIFKNSFSNGTGSNKSVPPDFVPSTSLTGGNYKQLDFDVAYSFFSSRGNSTSAARTLAAISLDTAKIVGIGIVQVLMTMDNNGKIRTDGEVARIFNILRNNTNNIGVSNNINNRKSIISRSVKQ